MTLGRTKASYIINHALAPYYKDLIGKSLSPSFAPAPCFVSCFDEAFNRVSNTKQSDLHLIYFDEVKLQATRIYLYSQFMGHGSATDLIQTLKDVHHNLNYVKNLLPISMDGPKVNWKMLKLVKEDILSQDPSSPDMLELGSCRLHVVHGAYRQDKTQQIGSLENL